MERIERIGCRSFLFNTSFMALKDGSDIAFAFIPRGSSKIECLPNPNQPVSWQQCIDMYNALVAAGWVPITQALLNKCSGFDKAT